MRLKRSITIIAFALITLFCATSVFAEGMIQLGDSLYKLSHKSGTDYEDGVYTGYDNIGWIKTDTVDDEHGTSVILGADAGTDTAKEGAILNLTGDKTTPITVYDFDLYVNEFTTGRMRLMYRATNSSGSAPAYFVEIYPGEIKDNDETAEFTFNEWHNVRVAFNCTEHTYTIFVDDMETAVINGSLNSKWTGIEFMRVTAWADDTYMAIDNYNFYHALTMPDGYETPVLSLTQLDEKVTESAEARIEANIETEFQIEKIDFYIDGELVYTDNEAPYIMEHLFVPGEYTVYAVATDIYGETGTSDEIQIISKPDTKPRIEHSLLDGVEYNKADLSEIPVSIMMTDAELAEGTVTVDGDKFADLVQGENVIDFSTLSLGSHEIVFYAKNTLGEYAEDTVNITVTRILEEVVWSNDYSNGAHSGYTNGDGQFIEMRTLRDEFKDSCVVGANTEQNVSKEGAWIPFDLKDAQTTAIVDFDIYFNAINGNGMQMMLILDGARPKLFDINSKGIVPCDGSTPYPFAADTWYHAQLLIDSSLAKYTLYIDGTPALVNIPISMTAGVAMDTLRLISKLQGTEETYFAVDNVEVRHSTLAPSILNVTSANAESANTVSVKDTVFTAYFTGALQPTSVYPSKFTLTGNDESIEILSAKYDSTNFSVTFEIAQPLTEGVTYRLEVAENVVMGNGEIYGEKLYADFTAVQKSFVLSTEPVIEETTLNAVITSTSDTIAYLVINVYDGETLKSSNVKELQLVKGENTVSESIPDYVDTNKAEIFIWDSIVAPACFASWSN